MKKIIAFVALLAFYSCTSTQSSQSGNDSTAVDASKKETTGANQDATTSKWSYSDDVDKMTSKKRYFASVDANELINFPAPYDGGSTATLTIRNMGEGNEATLSVSKGQFNTSSVDGGSIKVRFDDAQPITFTTSEPSDGSSELAFIELPNKLIKKLKTAKKIIIQAEFYDSGFQTMEFNTDGFKWEHN